MAKKRANGEGTVRKRADGRFEARLVHEDQDGRVSRQSFYGATSAEVRAQLKAAQGRVAAGAPMKDATRTLGEWAAQWCVTTLEASPRKVTTKALYRSLVRSHVLPRAIATRRLDRLRPTDIDAWIVSLRQALSSASINKVFLVLRSCLDDAVRDGLLARNPTRLVKQPAVTKTEGRHLSPAEVAMLLERLSGGRYERVVMMIAYLGLRKGEALALRWSDIDLDRSTLRITGTLTRLDSQLVRTEPKTLNSRRTLPLSAEALNLLAEQRRAQAADRQRAANAWRETGAVFTTQTGQPMDPRNVLRAVSVAAAQLGLVGVNVHSLRHSAATAMLESGVHLKGVSMLLGHADIRVTADTYAHLSDEVARAALAGLSRVFSGPPFRVGVNVGVRTSTDPESMIFETAETPADQG